MEDVSTRHEHPFPALVNIITAYGAARGFKFISALFAMLLVDLNYRQSGYGFWLRPLCPLPPLSLLLTHLPNHLEKIVRREIRIIIVHEAVRVEVSVLCLHPSELVAREYTHKASQQIVHDILYVSCKCFAFSLLAS